MCPEQCSTVATLNMFSSLRRRVSRRTSTNNRPPTLVVTEVSESESSTTPDPDSRESLKDVLQKKKQYSRRPLHIRAQESGVRKHRHHAKRRHITKFVSAAPKAHHLRQAEIPVSSGLVACVRQDLSMEGAIVELISQLERYSHIPSFHHYPHTFR